MHRPASVSGAPGTTSERSRLIPARWARPGPVIRALERFSSSRFVRFARWTRPASVISAPEQLQAAQVGRLPQVREAPISDPGLETVHLPQPGELSDGGQAGVRHHREIGRVHRKAPLEIRGSSTARTGAVLDRVESRFTDWASRPCFTSRTCQLANHAPTSAGIFSMVHPRRRPRAGRRARKVEYVGFGSRPFSNLLIVVGSI